MNYMDVVKLIGGLGLFLLGMKQMGDGMQKAAGEKMKKIIEMLTSNVFKGILVGTLVTGLIQSISATTVMIVGFVNAGLMSLTQAVGIIMGANIGTTVTAQLISFSGFNSQNIFLNIIKPDFLAPILLILGVVLDLASKKKKIASIGEIMIGLGSFSLKSE